MKKKFLLTGYSFDGYHGSMMHIFEVAKELQLKNYDVYIVSVEITNKIKDYVESFSNINLISLVDFDYNLYFDYVLAYHAPILTFLIDNGLKYNKIGLGSLSSILKMEQPSLLALYGYPLFVSNKRLVDIMFERYKINSNLFINSVPEDYNLNLEKKDNALRKIVIVSNHLPDELIEAKNILEKKGLEVKVIGKEYDYQLVTPNLLKQYDLVITIGKTAQYALYLGIPVYNYDHFGGVGYINLKNLDIEEYYNFSGRSSFRKIMSEEIVNEIIDGYEKSLLEVDDIKKIARERYSLSKNLDSVIKIIDDSTPIMPTSPEWEIYNNHLSEIMQNLLEIRKLNEDFYKKKLRYINFYKFINFMTFGRCYKNTLKILNEKYF